MNWKEIWMTLFGTTEWLGLNIGFWVSMAAVALIVIVMNVIFWSIGCRTDFADIQNKKECGGNRQWQNHYLRNWAANTKGKGII